MNYKQNKIIKLRKTKNIVGVTTDHIQLGILLLLSVLLVHITFMVQSQTGLKKSVSSLKSGPLASCEGECL